MSEFDDPYVYPGTTVLKNRFGLTDGQMLARVERELVAQRVIEGAPSGRFDLPHLQAIHRHLFQDIYDWAGELRTVEIAKGGNHFIHRRFIVQGMNDVHARVTQQGCLRGLKRQAFADAAATIMGDVNYVHPFREGNGRTQLEYLRQLCEQAGHTLRPDALAPARWVEASKASHAGDYQPMAQQILAGIAGFS